LCNFRWPPQLPQDTALFPQRRRDAQANGRIGGLSESVRYYAELSDSFR
jgi:hypothetical protein